MRVDEVRYVNAMQDVDVTLCADAREHAGEMQVAAAAAVVYIEPQTEGSTKTREVRTTKLGSAGEASTMQTEDAAATSAIAIEVEARTRSLACNVGRTSADHHSASADVVVARPAAAG